VGRLEKITLVNIASGVAEELFEKELAAVLENIGDIDTAADAVREITLKIQFKPNMDRDMGMVAVKAASKLAPTKPAGGAVYFGKHGSELTAYRNDPNQEELPLVRSLKTHASASAERMEDRDA
jgi:hypothetical protein